MRDPRQRMVEAGFLKAAEAGNPLTIFLRALSVPIVLAFLRLGVHPNLVTVLSLTAAGLACWELAQAHSLLFGFLWISSALLDYADGVVARMSGKTSYFGYLLDMLGDRVKLLALLATWSIGERQAIATALAITAGVLLVVCDVLSHVFVARQKETVDGAGRRWRISMQQVFFWFDMHTFVVYGLFLAAGMVAGYVGTSWLVVVLVCHLARESSARFSLRGDGPVQVNHRLLRKVRPRSRDHA